MSANAKPRPKPWETSGPLDGGVTSPDLGSMTRVADGANEHEMSGSSREAPPRPAALNSEPMNDPMSSSYRTGNGGYGGGMYGNSMMGNGLYGGNSMFGGGYGSMYNSGYGSMYGGGAYGSLYGNGYGGGHMGGMNGGPGGLGESTQATFQLIESLIGAVAGFAQMLESTYMATHNSFFSMISVAEQFSYLKEILGSFFGIFAMMKFLRRALYYVTNGRIGAPPKSVTSKSKDGKQEDNSGMREEFERFRNNGKGEPKKKRISWKPLIFFLAAVFGFPYLLNKFIAKVQTMQSTRIGSRPNQQIDPSKLEFARAMYDFTPENPQVEVTLKKGDLMAIMSKQDAMGRDSEWWKVRTKSGDVGYVPFNYIEIIRRQKKIERIQEELEGSEQPI